MKIKHVILAALTVASGVALAQPAPSPINKAQLGSSANVVGVYQQDIAAATRLALPGYNEQELGYYFEGLAKKYANGFDPLKINSDTIMRIFDIKVPEGDGEAQEKNYSFEISRKHGKIYLFKSRDNIKPYPRGRGNAELRLARATHQALLAQFGIEPSQWHSFNSRLLLMEGVQKLPRGGYSKPTNPVVDNIFSYGKRSIDGIMIEDSYVKVISKDRSNFEGLIIKWPRFQMHPAITRFDLKNKAELMNEALVHLKRITNPKHAVNIKMAIVLRPVFFAENRVFLPALKVGLYSRPANERAPEEKAENGELFYIDLLKERIPYSEPIDQDAKEGELQ